MGLPGGQAAHAGPERQGAGLPRERLPLSRGLPKAAPKWTAAFASVGAGIFRGFGGLVLCEAMTPLSSAP